MIECSDADLRIIKEFYGDDVNKINEAVKQLKSGEPLGYILGEWYFYSEKYKINRDCLIPRSDTEHLVDFLIKNLPADGKFLDLCTGSGCIAISTLVHRHDARGVGVDISAGAVRMAKVNSELNNVADRIEFVCEDINDYHTNVCYDIIVSNPPYINTDVIKNLDENVQREPLRALDGGKDGMDFYRLIINRFADNINSHGGFLFEIGYDQREKIINLAEQNGFDCIVKKDYGGNDRLAYLTKQHERKNKT